MVDEMVKLGAGLFKGCVKAERWFAKAAFGIRPRILCCARAHKLVIANKGYTAVQLLMLGRDTESVSLVARVEQSPPHGVPQDSCDVRVGAGAARRPIFWWPRKKLADLDLPHKSQEKCVPRGVSKVCPIPPSILK